MIKLTELAEALKEEIREDIRKSGRFFKHLSLFHTLLILLLFCGSLWFLKIITKQNITLNQQANNLELLMKNVQVMNEPAVLLKIIQEKAPTLPAETQCRIADTWFRVCSSRNIPLWIACGVAEVESGFNPNIKDSGAGAVGWLQVMPRYSKPYMNLMLGGYAKDKLKDPITNSICGLNILADCRDESLELGFDPQKAMELGLGHYNCGNVIINNGYASKVFSAASKYKDRFETSLKELHTLEVQSK